MPAGRLKSEVEPVVVLVPEDFVGDLEVVPVVTVLVPPPTPDDLRERVKEVPIVAVGK